MVGTGDRVQEEALADTCLKSLHLVHLEGYILGGWDRAAGTPAGGKASHGVSVLIDGFSCCERCLFNPFPFCHFIAKLVSVIKLCILL